MIKQKVFFIISKGLSTKQITKKFLEGKSPILREPEINVREIICARALSCKSLLQVNLFVNTLSIFPNLEFFHFN